MSKSSDWDEKAKWMRGVHATSASWAQDGTLLSLMLGPTPMDPVPGKTPEETQDELRKQLLERMRVARAGSPGLRRIE